MKLFITYLLILGASGIAFAQGPASQQRLLGLKDKQVILGNGTAGFSDDRNSIENRIISTFPFISSSDLRLLSVTESMLGKHYFYQQLFQQVPVYGAYVKVNTDKNGKIMNCFHTLENPDDYIFPEQPVQSFDYWMINGSTIVQTLAEQKGSILTLKQPNGEIMFTKDHKLSFTDTIVRAKVFNPDPLTTAGVTYGTGGTYQHFNDSDYALINDQRMMVTMPARYDNGIFYLENRYAKIVNIVAPAINPAISQSDSFIFTRKESGFKDVMALYHIYALQEYIQMLGFNNLVNYQLRVDAHATEADQSSFNYTPDTFLLFGRGGVPDAEDADVIVHEYSHAVSHSLNSNGISSNERRSLEEGICDAIACAYSKRLNPFRWRRAFSWDGNNPFWPGRNGESLKTYENLANDIYSDSEIWSSAINNLTEALGEDVIIKLMLSVIPQFTPNTTMPQAAWMMYDADSILNNGLNRWVIAGEFNYRKFGSFPTGANDILTDDLFTIRNSSDFARGISDVVLSKKTGGFFEVEVYDASGKMIRKCHAAEEVSFAPQDFKPGFYFLNIRYDNREGYYKLLRY